MCLCTKTTHSLSKKNIENLSRASGGGIHVLSSEKMITKKKLLQIKKNDLQGEFTKGEGNPQPIYIFIFFKANKHPQIPNPYRWNSGKCILANQKTENRKFQNL